MKNKRENAREKHTLQRNFNILTFISRCLYIIYENVEIRKQGNNSQSLSNVQSISISIKLHPSWMYRKKIKLFSVYMVFL